MSYEHMSEAESAALGDQYHNELHRLRAEVERLRGLVSAMRTVLLWPVVRECIDEIPERELEPEDIAARDAALVACEEVQGG